MTSLYNKIVLKVILIVSLTIVSVTTVSICTVRSKILPDIEKLIIDNMTSKTNEIDLWISYNMQTIEQMANRLEDTGISKENSQEILSELIKYKNISSTDYESLGFITLDGKKYVTDGSSFDVNSRQYFLRLKNENTKTVVSNNILSHANNENIVLIVTKIYDKMGDVTGYLSEALTVDYIKEIVKRTDLYGFNTYITNKNDDVIIGEKSFKGTDENTILSSLAIESNPEWTFVTEIPKNFVQKQIMTTVFWIAVSAVIILIISSLFVRKFAQMIALPAKQLQSAMAKAKTGKLVRIVPDEKISEFATLGYGYNEMLKNIERLMDEIKEKEMLKNEADNKAMYAQIKPHFLYNTLETIQAMAFDNDDEQVETAIGNLATLFRIGLSNDKKMITLGEELKHMKSYMNIQLLRYSDVFDYDLSVQGVSLDVMFMKFTLQPIVENAIYHGVKNLGHKGKISIKISEKQGNVEVLVENSCGIIDSKKIDTLNEKLKSKHIPQDVDGYGLFNVNSRLKLNFGEEYGIKLFVSDRIFTAKIIHPILTEM